jgi:Flp pilus assembly protein TadG
MTQANPTAQRHPVAALLKDRSGIAAVEFALVLPLMLVLYFGCVEVSQAISIQRMVTLTASTVANLVTQYPSISASQTMPDILKAATSVLTPYSSANAAVRVSLITIDNKGNATVAWSQSLNGSPLPTGQAMTLPAALDVPNTSLVYGETSYAYVPVVDYMNLGKFTLSSSVFMAPRSPTGSITLVP